LGSPTDSRRLARAYRIGIEGLLELSVDRVLGSSGALGIDMPM
jgi:hypothetical protein